MAPRGRLSRVRASALAIDGFAFGMARLLGAADRAAGALWRCAVVFLACCVR